MSETQPTYKVELSNLEISKPTRVHVIAANPTTGDVRVRLTDTDIYMNLRPIEGDFSLNGPAADKHGKLHPDGSITFSAAVKQEPRVKHASGCIERQTHNL